MGAVGSLEGPGRRGRRLALVLVVMLGVWIFARFGDAPPRAAQVAGLFERPIAFRVTPPQPVTEINVRAGAGREYRIIRTLPRSARVVGLEQLQDRQGAPWIRLSDNGGYIKQSILTVDGWAGR